MEQELVYAAVARCPCGAGLAYPEDGIYPEPNDSVFNWPYNGYWDCSLILLRKPGKAMHTAKLPFSTWNIKAESDPSLGGKTTRP